MKASKKLGIWMDHSIAYIIEFTTVHFEIETIESNFTNEVKNQSLIKSENLMHTKEKGLLLEYYKKISEVIKNYKRIILFGPADAKIELFDLLSEDERFLKVKIEIKNTDKMTENQQYAFVNEYFSKA